MVPVVVYYQIAATEPLLRLMERGNGGLGAAGLFISWRGYFPLIVIYSK